MTSVSNSKRKKCLVICGPTASGKSALADEISASDNLDSILVDSMQVYREIPEISNQRRSRPARLSGIVSVTEEWSVAHHRDAALDVISDFDRRFVLDAGTGMYLNAILLDFPLAPKVDHRVRSEALSRVSEPEQVQGNPRRVARELELRASGAEDRGSVWDGDLRFETYVIYLRPDRSILDRRILERSRHIVDRGRQEATRLLQTISSGMSLNQSVRDAIGVREMLRYASGDISRNEAIELIATRTRQLSRRQMRWFDKLLPSIEDRAKKTSTIDNTTKLDLVPAEQLVNKNTIHDIIMLWKD